MKKESFADKAHIYELPYILDFKQTKSFLKIGRNTLLMLLQTGMLPAFKLGNKWRIRRDDLEEFIEEQL